MVLVDSQGLSLGFLLRSAPPTETMLAEATLKKVRNPRSNVLLRQKPRRIVTYDGYDSYLLRERLNKQAIDLISPRRKNNK